MTQFKPTNWTAGDDAQVQRAMKSGATRRDLLKMFLASGASLAGAGTILGRATEAYANTPVRGGHMKAAGWSSSTADTLDPAKASLSTDYVRCCAIYNRLTFLDGAGVVQMELANSVESTDATVWTITLKSDVTFHNGKTLTSADVVFSLARHLSEDTGSKVNAIASQMTEITALDPMTVQITLAAANADLPIILALHHFMIVPDGTTDFNAGIGTGPFKLESFEPGTRSIMSRNEDYFKGAVHLDSFEYFAISDNSARVNALMSGDIQLAASVKPESMRLLDTSDSVDTVITTAGNYTNLNMRLDMNPGDKADFVEGVKNLINRELIQKSVVRGLAVIGNDQPISPSSAFHNADLKPREFDPDKAKALFEKSGMMGQTIPIVASDAADYSVEMATVLQQAGSDIGMKFDVQRVPSDGYWSKYWLKAPMHFGNINPRPTPDILFSLLYGANAKWNESQYLNPQFDELLVAARGELDFGKRKAMYDDMQVMVSNEAGTAIPAYLSSVDAKSTKVKGFVPNPLGGQMGYAFAEYVWLDA